MFDELWCMFKVKYLSNYTKGIPTSGNIGFCYKMLNLTSRSFAQVIQELPEELRDSVIFIF